MAKEVPSLLSSFPSISPMQPSLNMPSAWSRMDPHRERWGKSIYLFTLCSWSWESKHPNLLSLRFLLPGENQVTWILHYQLECLQSPSSLPLPVGCNFLTGNRLSITVRLRGQDEADSALQGFRVQAWPVSFASSWLPQWVLESSRLMRLRLRGFAALSGKVELSFCGVCGLSWWDVRLELLVKVFVSPWGNLSEALRSG